MKRSLLVAIVATLFVACQKEESFVSSTDESLIVTGSCNVGTRTAFGTPDNSTIPYKWSANDYIWLGDNQSEAITEEGTLAQFEFKGGTAIVGTGHIFYNMTDQAKNAKVLSSQSADGNLGNDGDFGYAILDEYNSFYLEHKTAYVWFDTKSDDADMPKLLSITLTTEGAEIAGERIFDFANNEWDSTTTNGSSTITLNFEGGKQLQSANEGVMAAMVVLPAKVSGTKLTITYTFEDESTFTEVKTPSKNFESGATQRISTTIALADLTKPEPELPYELRILTFEDDENKKFESFVLEYQGLEEGYWEINTWSDLIDTKQQDGDKLYAMAWYQGDQALYRWWDQNHTDLSHAFYDSGWTTFAGGGHAISDYTEPEYHGDYLRSYLEKYYDNPSEYWGWQYLQLMTPIGAHSGKNFAVHYGYKDFMSMIEVLPSLEFAETGPHIIDHMYVTCTNYMLNQTIEGVSREDTDSGDQFGGNWDGLDKYDDAWLKIVARGYASKDDTEPCSSSEFYLVNGKDVVLDWRKWDLTELGKVEKVEFDFAYSEQMGGIYGFTIPAYFAYDDVAVRFEK